MISVYLLLDLLHRFSSSDYAELTEHSCFTDYARNLNGFGLTAIGLAHSHFRFLLHGFPLGVSTIATPLGVPADLKSAVKKCSTT